MMRPRTLLTLILAGAIAGCSTTQPDDPGDPVVLQEPAPPPPATDPRVSELQVLVAELLDRIEVLNARLARLESGPAAAAPTRTVSASAATPASPAPREAVKPIPTLAAIHPSAIPERYKEALVLYARGRIDDARAAFQQILDADPNGELADNALYWIGETYYVTAKYNEAMKIFARIGNDYGDQNKAPDALLKIGLAYVKLGDLMLAKKTFNDLIARYPYSIPAATAKAELEKIKY